MSIRINKEYVNDTAKLIMHRLIAREIGRDPSLVGKAKIVLAGSSRQYADHFFVGEWDDVLCLSPSTIRRLLTSRDERMTRLRLSSPFVLAEGVDFEDIALRRRIWKAAKRVARRSVTGARADAARLVA
jgi:hypothetical protein